MNSSPDKPRSRTLHDREQTRGFCSHHEEGSEPDTIHEDTGPQGIKRRMQRVREAVAVLDDLIERARALSKDRQAGKE